MNNHVDPRARAFIFDCDGTLADTMPIHHQAWLDVVRPLGCQFPEKLFYELGGVTSDRIAETLNERFGYSLDPQDTAEKKEIRYLEISGGVQPIESVVSIAIAYKDKFPMSVASGGIQKVVSANLNAIELGDFFSIIVTADDVVRPKPAPDIFLEAARQMGVSPEVCQVFEDSDLGLEAARLAGMIPTDIRPWLKD